MASCLFSSFSGLLLEQLLATFNLFRGGSTRMCRESFSRSRRMLRLIESLTELPDLKPETGHGQY